MSSVTFYGLLGSLLVGLGLYGVIVGVGALRKILAFNLLGSGVFLLFGVIAQRGAGAGFAGDPVPQALVITGLVVAFAATALAVGLLVRLGEGVGLDDVEDALASESGLSPAQPAKPKPDQMGVEKASIEQGSTLSVVRPMTADSSGSSGLATSAGESA
ncbi:NADH-quinone oxidoreductase subunit K [Lamprobacter modestohalophilus]|uniref:NADH-quinone oxidoreductase subunit K n=1 Tax=Lamprobacter modestohalophilus TaxID=1064514 RepID=UPI002ADEF704|nr:NADH-quinone oxidoreductase subunit K [Lamprobacter modestohalophilus]MEA1051292.1 NADH-quinone oxidoreductase subunit K [Lamprobacter modestohalophilus]